VRGSGKNNTVESPRASDSGLSQYRMSGLEMEADIVEEIGTYDESEEEVVM
jgi:hypothetical protein